MSTGCDARDPLVSPGIRALTGLGASALAMFAIVAAMPVAAQEPRQHQTVSSRPRPDYDPAGARVGSFLVLPSVDNLIDYDDNIFRTDDDSAQAVQPQDDFIYSIRPEVLVASQWANHALNLRGGIDSRFYFDFNDEDTTDWFLGGNGRIDVRRDTHLRAGGGFQHLHEQRGDPNSAAFSTSPVKYDLASADMGLFNRWNRVSLDADLAISSYSYSNAKSAINGRTLIQSDRDRDQYRFTGRLGYELSPQYDAFIKGFYDKRDYDRLQGSIAPRNRDSDGYEIGAGVEVEVTEVVIGEFFVGYRSQSYDDPALESVNGPTGGVRVDWNITPLTTFSPYFQRTIDETTVLGASGIFNTSTGFTLDHELLRNLILSANFSYTNRDYEGATIPRDDDIYKIGIGAQYLINRYARAGIRYGYTHRDSTVPLNDYDENVVSANVRLQF